ncbi:hypothetical protein MKK70_24525 [Methylobacterium sp. E-041]|uniref:hypothetical protein n=1 Tax=Methylobacterium sp. E-041 TaxID=2836573 RepID=UPI001FBB1BC3|nr:hypothetical protein [Methylobacterium sp. E-041]MCJ2108479.1 hypothetical protein [Methylobacterium sp. E-041]
MASLFVRHGLNRCNRILKPGDPLQRAVGWHRVVLRRFHDEVALASFEAVEGASSFSVVGT